MLLDEIIEILSSTGGSLTDALLKTKVLLHQIKRKDLVTWVNNELDGYPDKDVPKYRIIAMEVRGNVMNAAWKAENQMIPIQHLGEDEQRFLTQIPMTDSLEIVEESIKKHSADGSFRLQRNLPAEAMPKLSKAYQRGNHVMNAWCVLNMNDVRGIVASVRSRLLDFALELRDVVGVGADNKQLEEKSAAVDTGKLFTNAIYGPVGNVYIQSSVTQSVTVNNNQGDVDGLLKVIAEIGIPKPDLERLKLAIKEDEAAGKTPDVADGNTGKWYSGVVSRAAKGTLKVGAEIVSSVAAKALEAYIGLPR